MSGGLHLARRHVLLGSGAWLAAAAMPAAPRGGAAARLAEIERAAGGRLGVFMLDTASGRSAGHRAGERFGMCSTFKLSLLACVLREADAGRLDLDEVLRFTRADLLPNSPDTRAHLAQGGMTIAALAEAAQLTSDNLAANLLLRRIGGPAGMTRFWRSLGDGTTRLDRYETEMNNVPRGEVRDTTTPQAIAGSMRRFVLGDVLRPGSRTRLVGLMERTATGRNRLRAALPAGWRAGDKTGTGGRPGVASKVNDLAVISPPRRAPVIVTAFYEADAFYEDVRPRDEAVLRQVGEVAVAWIG